MTRGYPRHVVERGLPLFSIGAVARMLDLSAATIRTWETRYRLVIPERSAGGQRLYSREQVDQLRFVRDRLDEGRKPAEAHRLLSERLGRGESLDRSRMRVVLAESRLGAAELLCRLLGTQGFEIVPAPDPATARRVIDAIEPSIVVIDTNDMAFADLSADLRDAGTKILPIELLEHPLTLLNETRTLLEH
jgi:DNA-binding transcriptional MerR regulator